MLHLPFNAHRYFSEPISGTKHIIFKLYKRFLNFTRKLESCSKPVVKNLFRIVQDDCRTTTDQNLIRLMLNARKSYIAAPENSDWRFNIVNELIQCKFGELRVPNFDVNELYEIVNTVSTSWYIYICIKPLFVRINKNNFYFTALNCPKIIPSNERCLIGPPHKVWKGPLNSHPLVLPLVRPLLGY